MKKKRYDKKKKESERQRIEKLKTPTDLSFSKNMLIINAFLKGNYFLKPTFIPFHLRKILFLSRDIYKMQNLRLKGCLYGSKKIEYYLNLSF